MLGRKQVASERLQTAPRIEFADDRGARREWAIASFIASFPTNDPVRRVVPFADAWARLIQLEMAQGMSLSDAAKATRNEAGFEPLTVGEYVYAIRLLADIWVHGKELRRWHNLKYLSVEEAYAADAQNSTVNPATMTFVDVDL